MENNPYAPPKAAVADIQPAAARVPAFFPVSRTKLIVMSTLTLTLYQFYWFYKNWAHVRANGARVLPLVRTIFTVLFCYSLFDRVRNHRRDLKSARLPAGMHALGWIVLTVLSNLGDRLLGFQWSNTLFIVTLLGSYASVGFLLPVQDAINEINRVELPEHDANGRFTVWNWLWMAFGGVFTSLGLLVILVSSVAPGE